MLKLCVAGAAGRMGNAIIQEAAAKGHQTVGAVEASSSPAVGKTQKNWASATAKPASSAQTI